jgi:hypothetical protein
MEAPVIQDMRYVHDRAAGSRRHPQRQVVILAALEALAKAANRTQYRQSVDTQVADDVLALQQLRAIVGLEIRVVAAAIGVELVLVGIQQIGAGLALDRFGHRKQGVRRDHVVVVEQCRKIAGCKLQCRVGRGSDVAVAFAQREADARLLGRCLSQNGTHVRRRRGIVGDTQLPVRIELAPYRAYHVPQRGCGSIKGWNDNRKLRCFVHDCRSRPHSPHFRAGRRVVEVDPLLVPADPAGSMLTREGVEHAARPLLAKLTAELA